MFTAIPIETSSGEGHSVYFRQFPFGNILYALRSFCVVRSLLVHANQLLLPDWPPFMTTTRISSLCSDYT